MENLEVERKKNIINIIASIIFSFFVCRQAILVLGYRSISEYDAFWHLITGYKIFEDGIVPSKDFISYTTLNLEWTNVNWLGQLITYFFYEKFSFKGLIIFALILFSLTLSGLYNAANYLKSNAIFTIALSSLILGFFSHMGVRPRVSSFAFLAILNSILIKDRDLSKLDFLIITMLMCLWNNIHGGVIYGYALIGFKLLDIILKNKNLISKEFLFLTLSLLLSLLSFSLHPSGFDALLYLINYPTTIAEVFYLEILELQKPSLDKMLTKILFLYTLFASIAFIINRYKFTTFGALSVLFFFFYAIKLNRGIVTFFIISLPYVSHAYSLFFDKFKISIFSNNVFKLSLFFIPSFLIIFSYSELSKIQSLDYVVSDIDNQFISNDRFPVELTKKFIKLNLKGRIFNSYDIGGFLSWALFKKNKIFIDGRGDLYSLGKSYLDYFSIIKAESGWANKLNKYKVNFTFIYKKDLLYSEMIRSNNWKLILEDQIFVVFQRVSV